MDDPRLRHDPAAAVERYREMLRLALIQRDDARRERDAAWEDGTSAKDWARLAREANAACIEVMNERDALRAKLAALTSGDVS